LRVPCNAAPQRENCRSSTRSTVSVPPMSTLEGIAGRFLALHHQGWGISPAANRAHAKLTSTAGSPRAALGQVQVEVYQPVSLTDRSRWQKVGSGNVVQPAMEGDAALPAAPAGGEQSKGGGPGPRPSTGHRYAPSPSPSRHRRSSLRREPDQPQPNSPRVSKTACVSTRRAAQWERTSRAHGATPSQGLLRPQRERGQSQRRGQGPKDPLPANLSV
jgi:hypothetical protein